MVPTLTATLGVKGERPVIGTRHCKDVMHSFASANPRYRQRALAHALRSGLGYYRARPQAVLELLGFPLGPTQSAEA